MGSSPRRQRRRPPAQRAAPPPNAGRRPRSGRGRPRARSARFAAQTLDDARSRLVAMCPRTSSHRFTRRPPLRARRARPCTSRTPRSTSAAGPRAGRAVHSRCRLGRGRLCGDATEFVETLLARDTDDGAHVGLPVDSEGSCKKPVPAMRGQLTAPRDPSQFVAESSLVSSDDLRGRSEAWAPRGSRFAGAFLGEANPGVLGLRARVQRARELQRLVERHRGRGLRETQRGAVRMRLRWRARRGGRRRADGLTWAPAAVGTERARTSTEATCA